MYPQMTPPMQGTRIIPIQLEGGGIVTGGGRPYSQAPAVIQR